MKAIWITLGVATMVCGGVALTSQKAEAQYYGGSRTEDGGVHQNRNRGGQGGARRQRDQRTEMLINLTGPAIDGKTPKGSSRYRTRGTDRSDFNVEVEDVRLPDDTILTVLVNGVAIGDMDLALGFAEFELNTQDGDVVPAIKAGDVVQVVDEDGAVILSGTF